ncbi:MAG: hypothetical protein JW846_06125 [Dehalococcoidia bacterium]|nr:hypothetical protein [Dehalococcoidia bacterium]
MTELKDVRKPKRVVASSGRFMLDIGMEDMEELDLEEDDSGFSGDQVDYEYEDAEFDRRGGYSGLSGL